MFYSLCNELSFSLSIAFCLLLTNCFGFEQCLNTAHIAKQMTQLCEFERPPKVLQDRKSN